MKGDLFDLLHSTRTQPTIEALMVERYGRHPSIGGVRRREHTLTLECLMMSDTARNTYRSLILDALDADDETSFRLTIVDNVLPSINPQQVKLAFGPWDLYYNGSAWMVRGLLDPDVEGTLGAGWAIAPGEGLDISGASALTLTNTVLTGVNALEVIWKPTDDNTYADNRFFLDDGTLQLYFRAADDKFVLTDGTSTCESAAQTFAAGALQHIVAVWGATYGLKLYVNGILISAAANAVALAATVYVGTDTGTALPERGELVCVRFYDTLSATQVANLYAAFVAVAGDPIGNARYVYALAETTDAKVERGKRTLDLISTLRVDGDPRWRSRDGDYWHWDVTASGDTETVTVTTDAEVYPVLYVSPTTARSGGLRYKLWASVPWLTTAYSRYPVKLAALDTSSLINTATTTTLNGAVLIGAATITLTDASAFPTVGMAYITDAVAGNEQISWTGKAGNDLTGCVRGIGGTSAAGHSGGQTIAVSKMLANGADLRVYDGALEIDRWIQDIDTATTDVWVNLDFENEQSVDLKTAIAGAGSVTSIDVDGDISQFPTQGLLLIGTEAFTYRSKSDASQQFLEVTRAVKGTSAGAHSVGDDVLWLQHDIWLLYGDETLTAPTVNDDYKPIFELDTSTNTSWVYQEYGDSYTARAGAWVQEVYSGTAAHCYTADRDTNATPWAEVGCWAQQTASLTTYGAARFYLYNPCGILSAGFTNGEKKKGSGGTTVSWIGIVSSVDMTWWVKEYELIVALADTWYAWNQNETLDTGSHYVGLAAECLSSQSYTYSAYAEAADCTVALDSDYTPAVTLGSEQTNYGMEATIENTTTGDQILIEANLDLGDVLEIDTDHKTVVNLTEGDNLYGALTQVGGVRRDWLPMRSGANVLEYTEAGVADVDVDLVWDRRYRE